MHHGLTFPKVFWIQFGPVHIFNLEILQKVQTIDIYLQQIHYTKSIY